MPLVGEYRGQALPYHGHLIVADPSASGSEEADLLRCLADAEESILGGSRRRVAVKAGQDTLAIAVTVELWDAMPDAGVDAGWEGCRELTVEFPGGRLRVENTSAGSVPLAPGTADTVALPGGPGAYRVEAWHRGRERAAAKVQELWEAEEADEDIASGYARWAGLEEYLLRIWPA